MYEYRAKVMKVVDGDTVDAAVDLGFNIFITERFRFYGVNAPETKGEEKEKGLAVKALVTRELLNKTLVFRTYKKDKYGRWLATIVLLDGSDYNKSLVKRGLAVPYMETE